MSSRRVMAITGPALSSAGFLQWLGPRWDADAAFGGERKLFTLAAGLHVAYFEPVLGPFARRRRATPGEARPALEEWLWLDRLFLLQAVTDVLR